ncbi:MAG: UvrB/UvrC motif-containing protein [Deltaproteobacteria bacterium]|nr:UvrB/UvrC motif-containing protein [Deltaproteobacteria bacterium]
MGKLCQCCNQREAKIHFTELKDQKKTEMHLCEVCAQEKNMVLAFPSLLSTLVKGGAEMASGEAEAVSSVCPRCGLAYSDFKAKGRIGCPACYDAFAAVLIPLLEKVHNASTHTGKRPPHEEGPDLEPPATPALPAETAEIPESVDEPEVEDELTRLTFELAAAVSAENYELCVELRDRIRELAGQEDAGEL